MAGPVLFRQDWSVVHPHWTPLSGPMPEAVQHHTGGNGPGEDLIGWLRGMEAAEMQRGDGLIALAYHWMVISGGPHDGAKIEVRPWNVEGGATLHFNDESRAICMSGDFTTAVPTERALDSTAELWADGIRSGFVATTAQVDPHSDYYPTACCGNNLRAALPNLRARVAAKVAGIVTPPPRPKVDEPVIRLFNPDGPGWWVAFSDGRVDYLGPKGQVVHGGLVEPHERAAFGNRQVTALKPRTYAGGAKHGFTIVATDGATYVPAAQK